MLSPTLHLWLGSSGVGRPAYCLCRDSVRGWCSAPCRPGTSPGWCNGQGWPPGSRRLAPRRPRSSVALCGPRWGKEGRPASPQCGAGFRCAETRGSSVDCSRTPAGIVAHGRCRGKHGGLGSGWGGGLTLLALVWGGWGNHMDPS